MKRNNVRAFIKLIFYERMEKYEFCSASWTILKEYMESRNITQKDMAESIGVSEKFVSNLINGKSKLSEEVALNLEKIFPDIKAEFWLDIEQNYRN